MQNVSPVAPAAGVVARQHHPTLAPAFEQAIVEPMISPAAPSPVESIGARTVATTPAGLAERENRAALEPAISRPKPSPDETTRPIAPAPVVVQPHVTPAPRVEPAAPAPAEPMATHKPAPTIQVTIGRIEVRATPPPVPPPKQRSTPLVMSLDDYLRQRNGGRR